MSSYLQYRQLRRQVEEDLAHVKRVQDSSSSSTSISTPRNNDNERRNETPTEKLPREEDFKKVSLVEGITVSRPDEKDGSIIFEVGWKENDPNDPLCWTMRTKWTVVLTCCALAIPLTMLTSIEGPTQDVFNAHFRVNAMAGSMTTGIYLIGTGVGSLFSGPFSETFGRNAVYFSTMIFVLLFIMAKALAPNYGAALTFRFLCAIFAASPMTVAGGTVGDIWTPIQIPFGLALVTFASYSGPILGPVISAYAPEIGWAWEDWISMTIVGAALVFVLLFQPETYSPVLLQWRAKHLRDLTGDNRYQTKHENASSLGRRLLSNMYLPFTMAWTEPIILIFSFYLILLYFVLFTFLNGYPYIFTRTYGITTSLTFIIWAAMMPGVLVAIALIPYIYSLTKKTAAKAAAVGKPLPPEVSLYWAMAGASPTISIASPILASTFFGYSLVCIFTSAYMYIIFVYLDKCASALGFMTFSRYVVAGALSPASVKMYENLGPHWSLTVVGCVAVMMAPVPWVLWRWGERVRGWSRHVVNKG
ncbi:MAG: hypothetical protein Q9220_007295 [cf. Caloplaca sp. 1 TL-2023]